MAKHILPVYAFRPARCIATLLVLAHTLLVTTPAAAASPEPTSPAQPASKAFPLVDGDRIVLVGDTFAERENTHGYIETRLTARFHDRNLTFRNLGWSADTPEGQSRVSFDWSKPHESWFTNLVNEIRATQPTVLMFAYGMASSFDGAQAIPAFTNQLDRLISACLDSNPAHPPRLIILSPIPHEKLPAPLPDPTPHNATLAQFNHALRDLAQRRNATFVPLFELINRGVDPKRTNHPLTENGIHLNAYGYIRAAEAIELAMGYLPSDLRLGVMPDGKIREGSYGSTASRITYATNHVSLVALDDQLPSPVPHDTNGPLSVLTPPSKLQVQGLAAGWYELRIDSTPILRGNQVDWASGYNNLRHGPAFDQVETLRQAIIQKNQLFFYRWRPQNQTYLFGFRKHEQGQNAREIPQFDPLIAEQEARIHQLSQPVPHTFELVFIAPADQAPKPLPRQRHREIPPESITRNHPAPKPVPTPTQPQPKPTFDVAPGFEISLYAENPLLAKPIHMNFDPEGRLWVASSSTYPQIKPGDVADDKILILEDTDGDGIAEKSTVFADGLLIPTGVEPGNGGAYVGQSTQLLFLKDTDGDGHADEKRVVLSSFGTEDTHHILHTLQWGVDGQLYMNQSIYIHSHIETPTGVKRLNSGGVWRFQPQTAQLEVFIRGFCNPWGHQMDPYGQSFVTDGAGFQGVTWGIPGAMYFTYAGGRRILDSISPGTYPKFCGLELIQSTQFPDDWQGNAITCDFRAHRIVRFSVTEQASGYVTQELPDLVRTTNVTFRPIDVKLGPDGALYVADWSNPIIQHGEVDFRDPRRDRENGRIWRIAAKDRPPARHIALRTASNTNLFDLLTSPNSFQSKQARRVLLERGAAIRKDLEVWTSTHNSEPERLQALWLHEGLDALNPALLEFLITAKDAKIRAAATRVLNHWAPRLSNPLPKLATLIADENPRVRVEAVRALPQLKTSQAAALALTVLDKPTDKFIDYALWLTLNDLAEIWVKSVETGEWDPATHSAQFIFALKAIEPGLASRLVSRQVAAQPVPPDGSGITIELIGYAGDASELERLFARTLDGSLNPEGIRAALSVLTQAARLRDTRPTGDLSRLDTLLNHSDPTIQRPATRLAAFWKAPSLIPSLVKLATSNSTESSLRVASMESLRSINKPEVAASLEPLTHTNQPVVIRQQAAFTLASLDPGHGIKTAIAVLNQAGTEDEALPLWRNLLSLRGSAQATLRHLPASGLHEPMAKAGLKAARENGRNEPELVLALAKGANLNEESQALSPEELKAIASAALANGDPARGELVYRRAELGCVTCHAIGGVGGKVGPDLTSIGASAPSDYLVESILYPNRKIKEGYHSVVLETKDDEELSGVLVRETADLLFIRDLTNRELSVPKANIRSRRTGGSLMPAGLIDPIQPNERLDLYRFLAELGKPGPFDASRGSVARAWRLRPALHTAEQFGEDKVLTSATTAGPADRDWTYLPTLVNGQLTADAIRQTFKDQKYSGVLGVYATSRFQTTRDGSIHLSLSLDKPLAAWIDGKPVSLGRSTTTALPSGIHTLVVKLDPRALPEHLRADSPDATFLGE